MLLLKSLPNKTLCAALLLLTSFSSLAQDENSLALSLLKQRTLPAVVGLMVQGHDDKTRHGTGFFVDNAGLFATNFSVVENARRITIRDKEGWLHEVDKVVAISRKHDLVLLRASGIKSKALKLQENKRVLTEGEPAIVVSNAPGLQWQVTEGQVTATEAHSANNLQVILYMAPTNSHSSGAPLVDQHGRVMGVVRTRTAGMANQAESQAVHVQYLRALMNKGVTLPLSATWTDKPAPKTPPARSVKTAPIDKPGIKTRETEAAEAETVAADEAPTAEPVAKETPKKETPKEAAPITIPAPPPAPVPTIAAKAPVPAVTDDDDDDEDTDDEDTDDEDTDDEDRDEDVDDEELAEAPPPRPAAKRLSSKKQVASHIGQVKTLAWGGVNADPAPTRVCPAMISLYIEDDTDIRVISDPASADAIMTMSATLDTSEECNMWGCFDGYRLDVDFRITNRNGRQLYQDRLKVDEDDVEEACDELGEEIADELEEYVD